MEDERVETGLAGLVYEPPETLNLPVPKPAAVNLPAGVDMSTFDLARLAREIAMNIRERPAILATFKITEEQYAQIEQNPFYRRALDSSIIEWEGAVNTPTRIKIEAAAILEVGMPVLGARMADKQESLAAAVETGKLFKTLAGIGEADRTQGVPGEKFTININLGADEKIHIEKDITPTNPTPEGAAPELQQTVAIK